MNEHIVLALTLNGDDLPKTISTSGKGYRPLEIPMECCELVDGGVKVNVTLAFTDFLQSIKFNGIRAYLPSGNIAYERIEDQSVTDEDSVIFKNLVLFK